jgi:hypothetical protein
MTGRAADDQVPASHHGRATRCGTGMPPRWRHRAGAMVVVVLVWAIAIAPACSRRDASSLGTTTTVDAAVLDSPTDTGLGDDSRVIGTGDDRFDREIDELARFVELERGLEFKRPVQVALLNDDEFEQRLLDDFDAEDRDDLVVAGRLLQALGFLPPGVDLVATVREVVAIGVLGFYDPETGELVVRGADLTPLSRQTFVHELTHALDDQWFDLDRSDYDDRDDEVSFGFAALVEGNAVRVEDVWTQGLSAEERRALDAEEQAFGGGEGLDIPPIVVELVVAPYELGPLLIDALLTTGGQAQLDAAFADPPVTSREVLEPYEYLVGFEPVEVATPPAEGEVLDDGMFGQFLLALLLASSFTPTQALEAASGWAGDRYVAWDAAGDGACVRVDIVTDGPSTLDDLVVALERWTTRRDGASVERPSPESVRLTSCG